MQRAFFGVLVFFAGPALADGTCSFNAFIRTDDESPVAIHAEPSMDSAVLGLAPVEPANSDYADFGAELSVQEMRNGWAKVTNVRAFESGIAGPDGWIEGRYVGLSAQTTKAFVAADASSEVIWSSAQIQPWAKALLDCDGEWALIQFDDLDLGGTEIVVTGTVSGWVRGVCAAQETSCDGVQGD